MALLLIWETFPNILVLKNSKDKYSASLSFRRVLTPENKAKLKLTAGILACPISKRLPV